MDFSVKEKSEPIDKKNEYDGYDDSTYHLLLAEKIGL